MKSMLLACQMAILSVLPFAAWAAPQGSGFTFQGQIKKTGVPVNGSCDFQFTLWDDALNVLPANQLGIMQSVNNVAIGSGIVSVELNAAGQFGSNAFNGDARWLGISLRCPTGVGAFSPLTPRTKINSSPYALHSLDVPLGGGDSVWSLNGNSAYYSNGNVGIGTNSPLGTLDLRAGASSFIRMDSSFGDLHFNGGSDGTFGLFNEGVPTGRTSFVAGNIERFSVLNNGLVGVGTGNPGMSLEVTTPSYYGTPALGASNGSGYAYLHVTGTADHSLIWDHDRSMRFGMETGRATGYYEVMRITPAGSVGIGTQAPVAKLDAYAQAKIGSTPVAVKGTAETSFDLFGNFFQGGLGVWGDSPSNTGVFGTSEEYIGVAGESQNYEGVRGIGHNINHAGVVGVNDAGSFGIAGFSPNGGFAGIWGNGTKNGVYGSTASGSDSGVHGRNDSGGWGLNGYSAGTLIGQGRFGGTGVEGISDGLGGYGVIGRAHGLNGVGVHAEAQNGNATALWAYNPGGRSSLFEGYVDIYGALNVAGSGSVRVLTITGGADLAERFEVSGDSLQAQGESDVQLEKSVHSEFQDVENTSVEPGMVVVIDPARPGKLKISTEPYDRKVAGIISGANSLSSGMVMKALGDPAADGAHPVALTGRVWCQCDASTGAIEPGDMLTTASTAGRAMKVTDLARAQGAIIGKAMTGLELGKQGLVLVLVNLQ